MGRHRPKRPARLGVFVVLVAIAVAATTWIFVSVTRHQADEKQTAVDQRQAAQQQASTLSDPILRLCAQGGDVAARLSAAGLCSAAEQVKKEPEPVPSGLTTSQVQALINTALARQQPVGPTSTQLAGAVQAFITANPTLFKAPAPTAAQIQAAVNTYMRAHPVTVPQPVPTYQVPGLGGFTGVPAYPPAPQWPQGRSYHPR
jgi:hypothetical protein